MYVQHYQRAVKTMKITTAFYNSKYWTSKELLLLNNSQFPIICWHIPSYWLLCLPPLIPWIAGRVQLFLGKLRLSIIHKGFYPGRTPLESLQEIHFLRIVFGEPLRLDQFSPGISEQQWGFKYQKGSIIGMHHTTLFSCFLLSRADTSILQVWADSLFTGRLSSLHWALQQRLREDPKPQSNGTF